MNYDGRDDHIIWCWEIWASGIEKIGEGPGQILL